MCIDYNKVDLKKIEKELQRWVSSLYSKNSFGKNEPLSKHLKKFPKSITGINLQSIKTRHGQFIEKSFAEWVRCIPGWGSFLRPVVNFQNGNVKEIDNISFNTKTGKLLIFELKRNYDTYYFHTQGYGQNFYDRLYDYKLNEPSIIRYVERNTSQTVTSCEILLVNVYGERDNWNSKQVIPKPDFHPRIVLGSELGEIFGECLNRFLAELDEAMMTITLEKYCKSMQIEYKTEGSDNKLKESLLAMNTNRDR